MLIIKKNGICIEKKNTVTYLGVVVAKTKKEWRDMPDKPIIDKIKKKFSILGMMLTCSSYFSFCHFACS